MFPGSYFVVVAVIRHVTDIEFAKGEEVDFSGLKDDKFKFLANLLNLLCYIYLVMFSNCSCYSVLARVTLESTKGSFYLSSNV
jgi:hypothetical protein